MPLTLDTGVLWTFTLLWLAIVPTPGANTLLITHTAITRTGRDVALALAGNLCGIALLAGGALLGWTAVLEALPWLRTTINIAGGAYLIYFGWRLLRRSYGPHATIATESAAPPPPINARRMFGLGFLTAISNAQAVVFITGIFAVTGVLHATLATGLVAVLIMICCNGSYLGLLGWMFRRRAVRAVYQRIRGPLEGVMGILFIFFGSRLILRDLSWRPF